MNQENEYTSHIRKLFEENEYFGYFLYKKYKNGTGFGILTEDRFYEICQAFGSGQPIKITFLDTFLLTVIEDDYCNYFCKPCYHWGQWNEDGDFMFDYSYMKDSMAPFAEELAAYVFHPARLTQLANTYNMNPTEMLEVY